VVSSNAGTTFEEIAGTGVAWWLQAYLTADRALVVPTLERAVAAGARAVVLTVDTPFPGPKRGLDDAAFGDLTGIYGVNHPELVRGVTPGSEHARDIGPDDLAWLAEATGLPVVVKGVLRGDDARDCVSAGAAAVWVSNHGGRQLDRSVATAHALPDVVEAVADRAEVYVDGGVRSGPDVLAALGLGACAAFVGRLPLLALAAGGTEGVTDALTTLRDELREALQLAGCRSLDEARDVVAH
jgi:4-hydroxymandelate oxidase